MVGARDDATSAKVGEVDLKGNGCTAEDGCKVEAEGFSVVWRSDCKAQHLLYVLWYSREPEKRPGDLNTHTDRDTGDTGHP